MYARKCVRALPRLVFNALIGGVFVCRLLIVSGIMAAGVKVCGKLYDADFYVEAVNGTVAEFDDPELGSMYRWCYIVTARDSLSQVSGDDTLAGLAFEFSSEVGSRPCPTKSEDLGKYGLTPMLWLHPLALSFVVVGRLNCACSAFYWATRGSDPHLIFAKWTRNMIVSRVTGMCMQPWLSFKEVDRYFPARFWISSQESWISSRDLHGGLVIMEYSWPWHALFMWWFCLGYFMYFYHLPHDVRVKCGRLYRSLRNAPECIRDLQDDDREMGIIMQQDGAILCCHGVMLPIFWLYLLSNLGFHFVLGFNMNLGIEWALSGDFAGLANALNGCEIAWCCTDALYTFAGLCYAVCARLHTCVCKRTAPDDKVADDKVESTGA